MEFSKVGQEGGLGVQNAGVGGLVGRDFAMKVEDHVLLLHGFEDGVVGFVRFDTPIRVGRHAPRIGLDTFALMRSSAATVRSRSTDRQCLLPLPSGFRQV